MLRFAVGLGQGWSARAASVPKNPYNKVFGKNDPLFGKNF